MPKFDELDITKPDGDSEPVAVLDDYIREVKEAIAETFAVEHHLTGEHKILSGNTSARPVFGKANRLYNNAELKAIQRDTGSAWETLIEYGPKFKVGTYTGDGASNKAITGVGFEPTWLQVVPLTGSNPSYIKTSDMASGNSHKVDAASTATDGIDTLDEDGFTLDAAANVNTVVYQYLAIRDVV